MQVLGLWLYNSYNDNEFLKSRNKMKNTIFDYKLNYKTFTRNQKTFPAS